MGRSTCPEIGGLSPSVLATVAWVWFFAAWRVLPDLSAAPTAQQARALFWASGLPLRVFGGATLVLGMGLSTYLVRCKQHWAAVLLCLYYGAAMFVIAIGSFMFVPLKPPDW